MIPNTTHNAWSCRIYLYLYRLLNNDVVYKTPYMRYTRLKFIILTYMKTHKTVRRSFVRSLKGLELRLLWELYAFCLQWLGSLNLSVIDDLVRSFKKILSVRPLARLFESLKLDLRSRRHRLSLSVVPWPSAYKFGL